MNPLHRTENTFPSRQYRYGGATAQEEQPFVLPAGQVVRFILGQDRQPSVIATDTIGDTLKDPFATLVLAAGARPMTLRALLAALPAGALREQQSFVIAEGGQIPWSKETAALAREFRVLLTRAQPGSQPDLYISTSTVFDSDTTFLQVIGWDPAAGAYQFYERRQQAWVWAGSSWDSLDERSRGKGPFDSHVNGALNMKELKRPWIHWHSQSASITDEVLAPEDPLRNEALWRGKHGAEALELRVVKPGIRRWMNARLQRCLRDGRLTRLREFLRQVIGTSTINLASSSVANSRLIAGQTVDLPVTFFLNNDALVDTLGLDNGLESKPGVDAQVYLECLRHFDVALVDRSEAFRFPGDTHFVFVVPEFAFEDLVVLEELLRLGVLSRKMAASLLMVDFPNPVFSRRRAKLMAHVSESASTGAASDFAAAFVQTVEAASASEDSAEQEFLSYWRLGENEWRGHMEAKIRAYFEVLLPRLQTKEGFLPVFELAESRRREFRRRPLFEFRLTTPVTNIPESAPLLSMAADGSVIPKF